MTPNEYYALKPERVENWYSSGMTRSILDLEGSDYHSNSEYEKFDSGRLKIHSILYHNVDGERGVGVYGVFFDEKPCAIHFAGGRGLQDSTDTFITDLQGWRESLRYAQDIIHKIESDHEEDETIYDPNEELINHYYGASVARFGKEVRLISSNQIDPFSGNAVFDQEKFERKIDAYVRPITRNAQGITGFDDPRIHDEALKALRESVIGERIDLSADDDAYMIFAVSKSNGGTFINRNGRRGIYLSWIRNIDVEYIGPSSLYDVFEYISKGATIDQNCAYVQEAASLFGVTPELVVEELQVLAKNPRADIASQLVKKAPIDDRVPEEIENQWYDMYALALKITDNPRAQRFCQNGYPTLEKAKETIEHFDRIAEERRLPSWKT